MNGRILANRGIVFKKGDSLPETSIQQIGIDLRVKSIGSLLEATSMRKQRLVLTDKSIVPSVPLLSPRQYSDHPETENWLIDPEHKDKLGWLLYPGTYEITFEEGCQIPSDLYLLIRQRSSLLRNGAIIHSSVFDPGFHTENMGTIMIVHNYIFIECGARVAQIYSHECSPVLEGDLYGSSLKGSQYQNDRQRNDTNE